MVIIDYTPLTKENISKEDLGTPILVKEGASNKYGILMGYTSNNIEVKLGENITPILLKYEQIYKLNITKK